MNKENLKSQFTFETENYHLKFYLSLILGLICLLIYSLTLCPTVAGGDSGELTTVAYTMGIAHPPGYPLYTLLGKLFTFIPYGPVAWRMNFFSAFASMSASLGLFYCLLTITRNSWASFLAASLFSFSPLIWRYSVLAEVFALNNLLIILFLFWCCRFLLQSYNYKKEETIRSCYMAAFFFGLGLTHHHTFLLVSLPMGLTCLIQQRKILLRPKVLFFSFCFLILGLTPYLYLVVAALRMPVISWSDTSTWNGFWHHFFRKDYGTFRLGAMDEKRQLLQGMIFYLRDTPRELFYLLAPLPILGIFQLWKKVEWRPILWATVSSFLFYLIVFHAMANLPLTRPLFYQVHIRFWQAPNIFIFLWTGIGAYYLFSNFKKEKKVLIPYAVSLAILVQVCVNFKNEDQHENWTTQKLGKMILDVMPNKAIFLSMGDVYTNSIRYLQQCEDYRSDVHVLDRELMKKKYYTTLVNKYFPDLNIPGTSYRPSAADGASSYHLKEFLEANIDRFPIYAANFKKDSYETNDKRWQGTYYRIPYGLVHRFYRKNVPLDLKRYIHDTDIILSNMKLTQFHNVHEGYWEELIANDYENAPYFRARQLMYLAQDNHNQMVLREVIPLMEDIAHKMSNPPWENYKLLGAAYNWLKEKKVGDIKNMLNAWAKYLELAPYDEHDRLSIEKTYKLFSTKLNEFMVKNSHIKNLDNVGVGHQEKADHIYRPNSKAIKAIELPDPVSENSHKVQKKKKEKLSKNFQSK